MQARDVMIFPVITVTPDTPVNEVAQLFLDKRISGAPVIEDGKLVGMVSEGDLLHREEAGTAKRRSWWLGLLTHKDTLARDYVREHGRRVADVMSRRVITATPATPVREIARLLEKNRIKRVPVVDGDQVVGIVSRANLIQAVASAAAAPEVPVSDQQIRERMLLDLRRHAWTQLNVVNITVTSGVVGLWGIVDTETERRAFKVAAETTPGVVGVEDHLIIRPFAS